MNICRGPLLKTQVDSLSFAPSGNREIPCQFFGVLWAVPRWVFLFCFSKSKKQSKVWLWLTRICLGSYLTVLAYLSIVLKRKHFTAYISGYACDVVAAELSLLPFQCENGVSIRRKSSIFTVQVGENNTKHCNSSVPNEFYGLSATCNIFYILDSVYWSGCKYRC